MPNEIHVSPTIKGASLNPQELFLFFPIRRNSDFQRFQRYVFRQDSDNRQMNDFRREQSHFQISISRSLSNPINSAENLKRPLPIQWERPFHDYFFKGLSQKSRLVLETDPNLDLSREITPFPGKSGASRMLLQGVVAESLHFAVSREEGCRNKKEIRP